MAIVVCLKTVFYRRDRPPEDLELPELLFVDEDELLLDELLFDPE